MEETLYDFPEYYDVAFSWDLGSEIAFFGRLFEKHVPFEVKHIVEPACGTGRFLVALPRHGYRVTGYDSNPKMVAYAQKQIADVGLQEQATAVLGDMRSARFDERFDAAINSINSISYLVTDDEILGHFRATGASLKPGGIYIVHLACAWDVLPAPDTSGWTMERDGVRVTTIWNIDGQDRRRKLSQQSCRLEIDDRGRHIVIEDKHTLRLWPVGDLKELAEKSGAFRLEAVYDEEQNAVPLNSRITGESGNHYYVLKAV